MDTRRKTHIFTSWGEKRILKKLRRIWKPVFGILGIVLIGWTLSLVPLNDIWATLQQLRWYELTGIFVLNMGIVFLFGVRWWLILQTEGIDISIIAITRYRLLAFGVSYFTPGPHFGGEPLQVLLLQKDHEIPGSKALASVVLDKLIEILVNFSFLIFGIIVFTQIDLTLPLSLSGALYSVLGAISLPIGYVGMLCFGYRPISWIAERLPWQGLSKSVSPVEDSMSDFCRVYPLTMIKLFLLSIFVWIILLAEYWLAIFFLGQTVTWTELIMVITAARLALLGPFPAALGALEVSQMMVVTILGFDSALGLGLSMLIRGRDVLFGLVGLLWGSKLISKKNIGYNVKETGN